MNVDRAHGPRIPLDVEHHRRRASRWVVFFAGYVLGVATGLALVLFR